MWLWWLDVAPSVATTDALVRILWLQLTTIIIIHRLIEVSIL